ncbi:MAG TPA: hypothetical protein ENN19_17345 [Chloroflexi bacterium]|nr:hypothetical protein [Chloroflexota bacterium]
MMSQTKASSAITGKLLALIFTLTLGCVPVLVKPSNAAIEAKATDSPALCPPLAPPTGPTVTVSTEADLRHQAANAAPGTTIMVSAGTYNLQDAVWIQRDGIAIRGATGNREDVILDGGGMLTWSHTHVIAINADDVTIADLTIRNGDEHGVSVQGSDRPTLYNLHILDTGYQLVKVNPVGDGSEDGLLACSRLEYTTTSPEDYTNGISAHDAHRWSVRDNQWYRIRTPGNAPAPTILFWSGSSDTVVERNLLVDCYQGMAFGNASHGPGDHTGGIVRNNIIYASQPHDSVIEMVHATGWLAAHNTALLLNPAPGLTWGMEARFSDTSGTFAYNLSNMDILPDRDGASAAGVGNVTAAQSSWFVDPAAADLHLVGTATDAINQAAPLAQVSDDFDGDARPIGPAPDVGADEYGVAPPAAVGDLRVSRAVTGTDTLTATLRWTPPSGAVTVTLRYAAVRITEANWAGAAPLTADPLPSDTEAFTAATPYAGGGRPALRSNRGMQEERRRFPTTGSGRRGGSICRWCGDRIRGIGYPTHLLE